MTKTKSLAVISLIWVGLIVAGFLALAHEEYRFAPQSLTSPTYPLSSPLPLDPHRRSLIVFVHPQCPCSEATLHNLEQIRTEVRDTLAITIVFTLPPGVPAGWEKGSLWNQASRMPNVRVFRDVNGIEARRFGVTASGHVLVYAPTGRLLFSGGITAARGHEGESPGEIAIVNLTKEPGTADTVRKPVFGCTLL